MIIRNVKIGDIEVKMGASAALPYEYMEKFNSDLFKDIQNVTSNNITGLSRIAWAMAKHAYLHDGENHTEPFPELVAWLVNFNVMDIYDSIDAIIELWGLNNRTGSTAKKKTT